MDGGETLTSQAPEGPEPFSNTRPDLIRLSRKQTCVVYHLRAPRSNRNKFNTRHTATDPRKHSVDIRWPYKKCFFYGAGLCTRNTLQGDFPLQTESGRLRSQSRVFEYEWLGSTKATGSVVEWGKICCLASFPLTKKGKKSRTTCQINLSHPTVYLNISVSVGENLRTQLFTEAVHGKSREGVWQ